MHLIIHTDGGSRGNPGPAAAGVVITDADSSKSVFEAGFHLGHATNNVAEYQGLIKALQQATEIGANRVDVFSDSELMVKQITGEYRVKSPDLIPLCEEAQMLFLRIDAWSIKHIKRDKNKRADELANVALDLGRDVTGDEKGTSPAKSPPSAPSSSPGFTARLNKKPGKNCPARCPSNTPFQFGPGTPANFCIYAAQAVFDASPTMWDEINTDTGQVHCPRCEVSIHIERQ